MHNETVYIIDSSASGGNSGNSDISGCVWTLWVVFKINEQDRFKAKYTSQYLSIYINIFKHYTNQS